MTFFDRIVPDPDQSSGVISSSSSSLHQLRRGEGPAQDARASLRNLVNKTWTSEQGLPSPQKRKSADFGPPIFFRTRIKNLDTPQANIGDFEKGRPPPQGRIGGKKRPIVAKKGTTRWRSGRHVQVRMRASASFFCPIFFHYSIGRQARFGKNEEGHKNYNSFMFAILGGRGRPHEKAILKPFPALSAPPRAC